MKEKKTITLVLAICLVLVLIISASYAWIRITKTSNTVNKITADNLDLYLDETASNGIRLEKAVPMTYQDGLDTTQYKFKLVNNSSIDTDYSISIVDDYENDNDITDSDKIADSKIRYLLIKEGDTPSPEQSKILENNRVIVTDTLNGNSTHNYILRLWIDSRAENDTMGKIFNAKLKITGTQKHN